MSERRPAFALWLTGLPASGKSTIVAALVRLLEQRGIVPAVLESDVLRREFAAELQYGEHDRDTFYTALALIGRTLTAHGVPVIFDATANKRAYRERARQHIPQFLEIYINTPLEVCIARDPKGIYQGGLAGETANVPGLHAAYELPLSPDLVIDGLHESASAAASRVMSLLEDRQML